MSSRPKYRGEPPVPLPGGLADRTRKAAHDMVRHSAPLVAAGDGSARPGAVGTAPPSRGIEEPREIAQSIALVDRAFAFVDLCHKRYDAVLMNPPLASVRWHTLSQPTPVQTGAAC